MKYILYVDESGDQGLDQVRSPANPRGADPFMSFGAVLVPFVVHEQLREVLAGICQTTNVTNLHFTKMTHSARSFWGRSLATQRICFFGLLSKKETLGDYKDDICGDAQSELYYNKCAHYLLEMVGGFMGQTGTRSEDVSIVFERRRHDYDRLRAYIRQIRTSPATAQAARLLHIDPHSIVARSKTEEPMTCLGDYAASAVYQAFNSSQSNFSLPEQRYLREVRGRFWKDRRTGQVADYGLKFVRLHAMNLSPHEHAFARSFYVRPTAAPSAGRRRAGPPGRLSNGPMT